MITCRSWGLWLSCVLVLSLYPSTLSFTLQVPAVTTRSVGKITTPPTVGRRTSPRHEQYRLPVLRSTNSNSDSSSSVNVNALLKYHGSIVIQMTFIVGLLTSLDVAASSFTSQELPQWIVGCFFYAFSLGTRVLNPLDTARPDLAKAASGESKGFGDRTMPSWTPPGVVFPIMWLLVIGPTRAYTTSLIYATTGHFNDAAIIAFMFHLSVGDVFNTINNAEQRFGAAVTAVTCVSLANVNAAYQYYQVNATAGIGLGLTMIWFTIASLLIYDTWKLNPTSDTTALDTLYPNTNQSTKFAWFDNSS